MLPVLFVSGVALAATAPPKQPVGGGVVKLNNGCAHCLPPALRLLAEMARPCRLSFPAVSFGLQVYDDATATQLTTMALGVGYRNFFSSVLAGNQQGFGAAIKASSVPRSEIFICGSVNTGSGACTGTADCKTQTAAGCQTNLQAIGVDYLDMSKHLLLPAIAALRAKDTYTQTARKRGRERERGPCEHAI
jgi:hypothetical protein